MDDSDCVKITEWLNENVPNGATLTWGQIHLVHHDVHTGWVDVSIPQMNEGLGWNWLFTVVAPDDDDAEFSEIVLAHDVAIWRTWNEEDYWFNSDPYVITSPDVTELPDEQRAFFSTEPIPQSGWTTDLITRSIAEWFATQANRPDIVVSYDPDIGNSRVEEAQELLDAVQSGAEPTYMIAPGVMATDGFMNKMLSLDPEEAAELTEKIIEALPHMTPDEED